MTSTRAVVVLARAPSAPGKTRLTAHLDDRRARELREALFVDTLAVAREVHANILVSYTPSELRDEIARLSGDATLVPQRGRDLGERIRHAIEDALYCGARHVALIGSDLPSLPSEHLLAAFARLDAGADVVFGPADDGGFYLIGTGASLPDIFAGVEWSSGREREQSIAQAHAHDLTVAVLSPWWDVDCPEDLQRILADPRPDTARRVRQWLAGD